MAAEIEVGVDNMLYVGEVPWHGLGIQLPVEVTAAEAMRICDLDWDVETAPIATDDQKRTSVDDYRVTRRTTDSRILGVVKKNYVPIQNREAFRIFDDVIGTGRAVYHTAGSLRGGSKVWLLAKLPGVVEVGKNIGPSDEVTRFVLLSNPHDGAPLQMLFTPVRVVCANTLSAALSFSSGDKVTKLAPRINIGHSPDAAKRVKLAGKMMRAAVLWYEKFGDFTEFLYRKQVNTVQIHNIISEVFPPNKQKEVTPSIFGHRQAVEHLFTAGEGHDRIAGTAWALFNAFTQYADHSYAARAMKKSKDPADKAYSVWMGGARNIKHRASKALADLAT